MNYDIKTKWFQVFLHHAEKENILQFKIQCLFIFQMFGMVVVFGLFNGLFFLPVLLSLIGPGSNNSHHPENSYDVNNSSCSSPSKNDDQQSESLPPRLELNTDL